MVTVHLGLDAGSSSGGSMIQENEILEGDSIDK